MNRISGTGYVVAAFPAFAMVVSTMEGHTLWGMFFALVTFGCLSFAIKDE